MPHSSSEGNIFSTVSILEKIGSLTMRRNPIDGLVQHCSISIANALEIMQSCTKPSIEILSHINGLVQASPLLTHWRYCSFALTHRYLHLYLHHWNTKSCHKKNKLGYQSHKMRQKKSHNFRNKSTIDKMKNTHTPEKVNTTVEKNFHQS